MHSSRWIFFAVAAALPAFGQAASEMEIANLREDVRGLSQKVADLSLRVEQLEAENAGLREKSRSASEAYATLAQLNQAVADLNRALQSSVATAKEEVLSQVGLQIEKISRPANAGPGALGRGSAGRGPTGAAGFSESFPKEGESYTVQRGDTLAAIAKKTGAKVQDIINANRLADPAHIRAGQSLFIPGGK